MVKAREVWQSTHNAGKTLDALRGFHCVERQLLQGLKRCAKNDVVTALTAVGSHAIEWYIAIVCHTSSYHNGQSFQEYSSM